MPVIKTTDNYFYRYILKTWKDNRNIPCPVTGEKRTVKIIARGSSRSGKTWNTAQAIWTIGTHYADSSKKNNKKLDIRVFRDEAVNARTGSLPDFVKCYTDMGLIERAKDRANPSYYQYDYEVIGADGGSQNAKIRFLGHTIMFLGIPEKEATQCDIAFVNEIAETQKKPGVLSIMQRCELLFIADLNPSTSEHFCYDITGHNVFQIRVNYLDNRHLPSGLRGELEEKCPWDFADSHLEYEKETAAYDSDGKMLDGFLRRIWDKPERPETAKESEYHLYRAPNELNYKNKTVDRFRYLVYAEGIASALDGAVYREYKWIEKMPQEGFDMIHFGLDFGYASDKTALTRVGIIGRECFIEGLTYQITPTPDICFDSIEKHLFAEERRRSIEFNGIEWTNEMLVLQTQLESLLMKKFAAISIEIEGLSAQEIEEHRMRVRDLLSKEIEDHRIKILEHKEKGIPISAIYVVCDSADAFKDYQFVTDLNMIARNRGLNWNFEKVGGKPIVEGIALVKRFDLRFTRNDALETELNNYVYGKDIAGIATNMPDTKNRNKHYLDSFRYIIWKKFKHLINTFAR
jgi:hypothetical protein